MQTRAKRTQINVPNHKSLRNMLSTNGYMVSSCIFLEKKCLILSESLQSLSTITLWFLPDLAQNQNMPDSNRYMVRRSDLSYFPNRSANISS